MSKKRILAAYRNNPSMEALGLENDKIDDELVAVLKAAQEDITIKVNNLHRRHVDLCEKALSLAQAQGILPPDIDPRRISISFGPKDDGTYYRLLKEPHTIEETYAEINKSEYVVIRKPEGIAAELIKALV